MKDILIMCEVNGGCVHRVGYELLNKAKELSDATGKEIHCLVMADCLVPVEELAKRGADKVILMKDACFESLQERLFADNIIKYIDETEPDIVLFGATNFGRSIAPRVAAALRAGLTADCTELKIDEEGNLIQIRPAFSDNILAHIKSIRKPQMATVRYKEFAEASIDESRAVNLEVIGASVNSDKDVRVIENLEIGEADITDAEVVVAVGRGLKKAEDLEMFEELAKLLGGQVGVSRALVDADIAPSAIQVGYSGNRVKPKLYIACGISGAPQHVAGMKESDYIVAVNSDPGAAIFSIANLGIVGDMYKVVPAMIEKIKMR